MTDNNLDELRNKTQSGDRLNEAADGDSDDDPSSSFQSSFIAHLESSESNVSSRNISVNDVILWSMVQALKDHPEENQELREKAGVERDSQSALISQLARIGLAETYPELADELREGVAKHATENL